MKKVEEYPTDQIDVKELRKRSTKSRNKNQNERRSGLKKKIRNEKEFSSRKNAAIDMYWSHLRKSAGNARLIHKAISEQEKNCKEVIDRKKSVIKEVEEILKQREHDYVVDLKKQESEIMKITDTFNIKERELKDLHGKEIKLIEKSYENKRKEVLENYDKEYDNKLKERNEGEKLNMNSRVVAVEKNNTKIDEEREGLLERYAIEKEKYDGKLHKVEEDLGHVRYVYELNSAKLKHFVQYLIRINIEKEAQCKSSKVYLQKLQDQLYFIREKFRKDDKVLGDKNRLYTQQLRRLTRQYNNMLRKYQLFRSEGGNKYKKIWQMNDNSSRKIIDKLQSIDKYLTNNVLQEEFFPEENTLPSLQQKKKLLRTIRDYPQRKKASKKSHISKEESRLRSFFERDVLTKICDSAGFLSDNKVRKMLDKIPQKNERNFLQIRSILETLGITRGVDLKDFIEFFAAIIESEGGDVNLNEKELLDKYLPTERIISVLKDFVEYLREQVSSGNTKQASTYLLRKKNEKKREKQVEYYWESMENFIVPSKMELWGKIRNKLGEYRKDLEKREKVLKQNNFLREQNQELKELLNSHLSDKINEELFIPPNINEI